MLRSITSRLARTSSPPPSTSCWRPGSATSGCTATSCLSAPTAIAAVVDRIVEIYTGPLFRAALELWVAAASDAQLRVQIAPFEQRIGRETHRLAVELLGADESRPGVREAVQATLDLARGLGLANLLSDDGRRRERIVEYWVATLEGALATPT